MLTPSTPPAAFRLVIASLIGAIIIVLTVASHRETCGWNTGRAPTYECGLAIARVR